MESHITSYMNPIEEDEEMEPLDLSVHSTKRNPKEQQQHPQQQQQQQQQQQPQQPPPPQNCGFQERPLCLIKSCECQRAPSHLRQILRQKHQMRQATMMTVAPPLPPPPPPIVAVDGSYQWRFDDQLKYARLQPDISMTCRTRDVTPSDDHRLLSRPQSCPIASSTLSWPRIMNCPSNAADLTSSHNNNITSSNGPCYGKRVAPSSRLAPDVINSYNSSNCITIDEETPSKTCSSAISEQRQRRRRGEEDEEENKEEEPMESSLSSSSLPLSTATVSKRKDIIGATDDHKDETEDETADMEVDIDVDDSCKDVLNDRWEPPSSVKRAPENYLNLMHHLLNGCSQATTETSLSSRSLHHNNSNNNSSNNNNNGQHQHLDGNQAAAAAAATTTTAASTTPNSLTSPVTTTTTTAIGQSSEKQNGAVDGCDGGDGVSGTGGSSNNNNISINSSCSNSSGNGRDNTSDEVNDKEDINNSRNQNTGEKGTNGEESSHSESMLTTDATTKKRGASGGCVNKNKSDGGSDEDADDEREDEAEEGDCNNKRRKKKEPSVEENGGEGHAKNDKELEAAGHNKRHSSSSSSKENVSPVSAKDPAFVEKCLSAAQQVKSSKDHQSGVTKINALDYLISKYLVQNVDVPYKPCNRKIRELLDSGETKICFMDLIELQIEKSFTVQG